MTSFRRLASALALLLAATAARAQEPLPEDELTAAAPGPELRRALREYYVHVLVDELGVERERSEAIEPLVHALLDAQRAGGRDVLAAGLLVRAAAEGRGDAAAALAALEDAERDALAATSQARDALLGRLDLRQKARLLAFEHRFRQRVRELVSGRGPGGPEGGPGGPGGGPQGGPGGGRLAGPGGEGRGRPPGGPGAHDGPGRPPGGPDGFGGPPPGGGPGRRPGGPMPPRGEMGPPPGGPLLDEDLRATMDLLFVHRLRTELGLDEARTLRLLPLVEEFVDARLAGETRRRDLHRRLRASAWDEAAGEDALEALVREARAIDASVLEADLAARRKVVDALGARDATRFLVIARRLEQQARRQAGAARRPEGPPPPDSPWRRP